MADVKEDFVIPKDSWLWEYIGDLSQDILLCSYNEDDVRSMWRRGTIDQEAKEALERLPDVGLLQQWLRDDGRYSDQLTAFVIRHGGWSPHWGWPPVENWTVEEWGEEGPPIVEVDPLTPEEQAIVDAFAAKYNIVERT